MAAALVLVGAAPADAQFSVDRTQIRLSGRAQSAVLRVTNDSAQSMRFDVKIFAWDQDANGEDRLGATTEAVAAPGTMTLGPKESRSLRIGTTALLGAQEKTYRLVIEELPVERQVVGATVAMRTRLSIPVFLAPAKGEAKLDLGVPSLVNGELSVVAKNIGTVHLQLSKVTFRGIGANKQAAFETVANGGGYILPGRSLVIRHAGIAAAQCRATSILEVQTVVNGEFVTHDTPLAASACGR